jgi:hypothetical protein
MSDPVLAILLVLLFTAALALAAWFRTLDGALWREARIPLITGVVAGIAIAFATFTTTFVATGVVLTAAALYVRLHGRESEAIDGMALGALTGVAAAAPLILRGGRELLVLTECILAGAVAGYGITFALTQVRDRARQAAVDAATVAVAIAAAWLPAVAVRTGRISARDAAVTAVVAVPLFVALTVFRQWPIIRAELSDEARLGFIDAEDVRATAHPLRRLGRAGWYDARAHREFVRIAQRIALRKRQQRSRSAEAARLYQLEVIKLRMELQEMTRIDHAMRMAAEQQQPAR